MAECGGNRSGESAGLLVGLVAGSLIGAAGLGLWLLNRAEQRRQGPALSPSRRRPLADPDLTDEPLPGQDPSEGELHDKVQRLNLAIADVRRQLETLGTDGTVHR
jgi:hypothetical protein